MITVVYPLFDGPGAYQRMPQFTKTLQSWQRQDGVEQHDLYELIVVDDGSPNPDEIKALLARFATGKKALPLRYVKIDVLRLEALAGIKVWQRDGANNPSAAWNVGATHGRGKVVAFTSPEICHTEPTNLLQFYKLTSQLGPGEAVVADVYDKTWAETPMAGYIGGGPQRRPYNFFAGYPRAFFEKVGGFDEWFLEGRAFDDTEFLERWQRNGGTFSFTGPRVHFEHLEHPRPDAETTDATAHNRRLYERRTAEGVMVANQSHAYGSPELVVEEWRP